MEKAKKRSREEIFIMEGYRTEMFKFLFYNLKISPNDSLDLMFSGILTLLDENKLPYEGVEEIFQYFLKQYKKMIDSERNV